MYRWVRKIHMYAGLLSFTAFLIYGVAGLHALLLPAPPQRTEPEPATQYIDFQVPGGMTDKQVADRVYAALALPLTEPVPEWAMRRNDRQNLALDFYTASGIHRVEVLEAENKLKVESTVSSLWQYLDNLHGTTLQWTGSDLRLVSWGVYNEFATWSLLGMTLSGIYLWLATRPRFRAAQYCFAISSGAFVLLYALTR